MLREGNRFPEYDNALIPIVIASSEGKILYKNELFNSISPLRKGSFIIKTSDIYRTPFVCDLNFDAGELPTVFFRKTIGGENLIVGMVVEISVFQGSMTKGSGTLDLDAIEGVSSYIKQAFSSDFFERLVSPEEHKRIKDNVKRLKKIEMSLYSIMKMHMLCNVDETSRLIVNAGLLAKNAVSDVGRILDSAGYHVYVTHSDRGNMRLRDVRIFVSAFLCSVFCALKCSVNRSVSVDIADEENKAMRIRVCSRTECVLSCSLLSGDIEYIRDCISFLGGNLDVKEGKDFEICIKLQHYTKKDVPEIEDSRLYDPAKEYTARIDAGFAVRDFKELFKHYGLDFIGGEKW